MPTTEAGRQLPPSTLAEAYWRRALRGVEAPTLISFQRPMQGNPQGLAMKCDELVLSLPEALTAVLQSNASETQLRLHTFVLGAWARVLS